MPDPTLRDRPCVDRTTARSGAVGGGDAPGSPRNVGESVRGDFGRLASASWLVLPSPIGRTPEVFMDGWEP